MLQQGEEGGSSIKEPAEIPFAPAVGVGEPALSRIDEVLETLHRWRFAAALLFGSLILGAGYFAYQSQLEGVDASGPQIPSTLDAAAAGGSGSTISTDAPAGPSTVSTISLSSISRPATSIIAPATTLVVTTTVPNSRLDPTATPSRSTPSVTRPTSSAATRSSTTAPPPTTAPTTAPPPTPTAAPSTTPPSSAAPSTPPAPSAAPTTAPSTTPSTTAAPRPVFIGDRVSTDFWDGPGVPGVRVRLFVDADRNGIGDRVVAEATTSSSGRYGFDVEPGCYVVGFSVPSGTEVLDGELTRALCLDSGQQNARIDLLLKRAEALRAPSSCEVQIGSNRAAGVEVQEPSGRFASFYVFYDRNGREVLRTSQLGPPDDVEGGSSPSQEWTSSRYGFEETDVWSVAAGGGGGEVSSRVQCRRALA